MHSGSSSRLQYLLFFCPSICLPILYIFVSVSFSLFFLVANIQEGPPSTPPPHRFPFFSVAHPHLHFSFSSCRIFFFFNFGPCSMWIRFGWLLQSTHQWDSTCQTEAIIVLHSQARRSPPDKKWVDCFLLFCLWTEPFGVYAKRRRRILFHLVWCVVYGLLESRTKLRRHWWTHKMKKKRKENLEP